MPYTIEWDITVSAPAGFVVDYLREVHNWPAMQLLAVDTPGVTHQELRWEGPPWSVGSGLVNETEIKSGFVRTKSQFRYEVQSPQAGELYRLNGKKMGVNAVISCSVREVDPRHAIISYRSVIDGWATTALKLLPVDKMAAQMRDVVSSVIERAWLRSLEGGQPDRSEEPTRPAASTDRREPGLEPADASPVLSPAFCVQCGTRLADGAAFCHGCGTEVSAMALPDEVPTPAGAVDAPTPAGPLPADDVPPSETRPLESEPAAVPSAVLRRGSVAFPVALYAEPNYDSSFIIRELRSGEFVEVLEEGIRFVKVRDQKGNVGFAGGQALVIREAAPRSLGDAVRDHRPAVSGGEIPPGFTAAVIWGFIFFAIVIIVLGAIGLYVEFHYFSNVGN